MTPIDISSALAAEHIRDLHRAGAASRLAALAHCCTPGAWARAGRRIAAAFSGLNATLRRSYLGPTQTYCSCP